MLLSNAYDSRENVFLLTKNTLYCKHSIQSAVIKQKKKRNKYQYEANPFE